MPAESWWLESWWLGVLAPLLFAGIGYLVKWYRDRRDRQEAAALEQQKAEFEAALEQQKAEFEAKRESQKAETGHRQAQEYDAFQEQLRTNRLLVEDVLAVKNIQYTSIEKALREMNFFAAQATEWFHQFSESIENLEEADETTKVVAAQTKRLFEAGLQTQSILIAVLARVCEKIFDVQPIEMKLLEEEQQRSEEIPNEKTTPNNQTDKP